MTREKLWMIVLVICYVLILSGGVNAGFSKFFMAVPFMLVAAIISLNIKKKAIYLSLLIIPFSVILNVTLTRNPIVFPILSNGYIEILSDGYHHTFKGGGGVLFDSKKESEYVLRIKKLTKGERYAVTGVGTSHPDFSTQINLQTTVGGFSQSNYLEDSFSRTNIVTNKEVHSNLFSKFSFLMNWPLLFMAGFPIGLIIFGILIVCLLMFARKLPES